MYLKNNNFRNILKLQNNIMKKEENMSIVELIDDKLKMIIELQKTPHKEKVVIQPTIENESELINEETLTQNKNDQKCDSTSSSFKNTNHQKSAQNSIKSEKVKSLAETTLEENQRKQQVGLADSIHRLTTLNINSQQINPVSTEETVPDVIQLKVNNGNQSLPNVLYLMKPPPKLVDKLITFLSEDLIRKTCEVFVYNYFNF